MQKKMRRSFSVPGNVKNAGFRRTNSQGLIRVVPVTPRPIPVDRANSTQSGDIEETPPGIILHYISLYSAYICYQLARIRRFDIFHCQIVMSRFDIFHPKKSLS